MLDEETYTIAKNKHGLYCVPKSSAYTYTSKTILGGRVHEASTIRFIIENSKGLDVIHAGAGFGDFLPALSKGCSGNIWSMEPNYENYLCAKKTIELNDIHNVHLLNCGLGEVCSNKYFKIKENGRSLGPRTVIADSVEFDSNLQKCEIFTLDELMPLPNVSILHLDTEGYEFEILKGATKLIEICNPLIILEIDSHALKYNEYMRSIGYKPSRQLIYNAREMVFVNTVYDRL
ncbi:MAG TPA: FkbM family methyltransferase [Methylocystis sp.]|nr:FkbM family methyltransferase [Methylocystis sp.]